MRTQVKDIMISPVITATSLTKASDLMDIMTRKKVHAIPIVSYEKQLPSPKIVIQGIVTSSDLIGIQNPKTQAGAIMTSKIHIIHKDSSSKSAARMMLKHNIHHLIVMDEGQIIGIISSMDFVKLVAEE